MKRAVGFCGLKAGRNSARVRSAQKLGCALRLDPQIECIRGYEHAIGIFEPPRLDTIDPDGKSLAERGAGFWGWGRQSRPSPSPQLRQTGGHTSIPCAAHARRRCRWLNVKSRDRLARTASALKTTALSSGAIAPASVVLPAPGRPMIRTLRFTSPHLFARYDSELRRTRRHFVREQLRLTASDAQNWNGV